MLVLVAASLLAPAAPATAAGSRTVLIVGDSVTVGAAPAVLAAAPAHGWSVTIDAKVGRTTAEGVGIVAAHRPLPSVVVVALGNNDGMTPSIFSARIDAVMRELVGVRHVVWYTMTPFASWVPAANAQLVTATARWPNLRLADWSSVSETTPGALNGRGPHLYAPGARAWAALLFDTLRDLQGGMPIVESFGAARPAVVDGAWLDDAPVADASALHGAHTWFVSAEGRVVPTPGTPALGSLVAPPAAPISGMAATPDGRGYWLTGKDGGVFSFGDADFFGSTGALHLNRPIVAMSATPTGRGYWLVASDGGVFSFGDARFHGSTGALRIDAPVVGLAAAPQGRGYWLLGADGGVFSFGAARYAGSGAALHAFTGATFLGISTTTDSYELAAVVAPA